MNYRRLGRSGLQLSSVGFGTAQLRMISERQAIETLHRGFELGVNLVHTAPDYGGAEDIVAKAVATSRHKVIVCSQAYDRHNNFTGPVDHFERLFEATCEKFGTGRLELFGIACIDDREAFRENVWGSRGMVEFLLRKKQEGRIGSIFCTTHGGSTYLRRLILCLADLRRFMTSKRHQTGEDAVFVAMQYIEELEHSVAYHRAVNATPLLSLLRRKFGFHS